MGRPKTEKNTLLVVDLNDNSEKLYKTQQEIITYLKCSQQSVSYSLRKNRLLLNRYKIVKIKIL